ncbi:MAG: aminotransferase class I/II-fold pyridoxal phosphate-dependent enzyme [bacterium]|nr:aminotransferase class I/II-fold pyridoxal phosphate-dependent enzyme [bacterium]
MSHGKVRFNTLAVHGGGMQDLSKIKPVSMPIYQSSEFVFNSAEHGAAVMSGQEPGFVYSRLGNPTCQDFEKRLALLEGTDDGLSFASGMAAIAAIVFTYCRPGDNIISSAPIYGGTFGLFKDLLPKMNIEIIYVPANDIHNLLDKKINDRTKLVYLETPANPTLDVVDLAETIKAAKARQITVAVDNTFATPCLQKPIQMGADIVMHSATKYICGHGDTTGGVVVASKAEIDKMKPIAYKNLGGSMAPFTAWLMSRGLQTLPLRVERHSQNAMIIARFLEKHPKVEKTCYPGLESCPSHAVAKKQMSGGYGGVLAIDIKGGREAGRKFQNNLKLCKLAVSLGSVDTLVTHPASTTHLSYSEADLAALGMTPGFVRIAVGIEDPQDVIEDLDQALSNI